MIHLSTYRDPMIDFVDTEHVWYITFEHINSNHHALSLSQMLYNISQGTYQSYT